MDAKEYLESYRLIQTRINVLQAEIERLRAEAESVSINLDGMPKAHGAQDKTARLAIQLAEHETVLSKELSGLWSRRMRIINLLGEMKNHRHQVLLQRRYIDCETWETIAYEMGISWRYCYMLHGSALAELNDIMKNHS